jgi:hypothetical protein
MLLLKDGQRSCLSTTYFFTPAPCRGTAARLRSAGSTWTFQSSRSRSTGSKRTGGGALALGEEILGGRVGRLVIQQAIASLALHVRLAGEEENLYRLGDIGGGQRGNGQHQEGSNAGECVLHFLLFLRCREFWQQPF